MKLFVYLSSEQFRCILNTPTCLIIVSPAVFVKVCELQRNLKASQAEQREALERAAAAVTLEQKAMQDSVLQVR